ncbi:amino acid adenylation domain-containing protein [Flavobacterium sp. LS1R49]|uniref:Amino acid adenylation domain-containing protein n=1 Tax=Flavobacterium shii TaxID=2987687 RepID=A0A9X2ZEF3_9FLAO|nr:non-ribosomal peptide synthetase [Flavobacterium shii]MCV9927840.1 amino acid adenylation domain-containing protein [Flavobacterium shii]
MEIRLFIKRLREEGVMLKLNNNQLEIVLLNNHIEDETLELLKKHKQDIIAYFSAILSKNNVDEIQPVKEASSYPLTASQHRFWMVSQIEATSLAYNMPVALQLKGKLDLLKFEESFLFLINRHEALRTSFELNEAGEVNQFITSMDDLDFSLNYVDLSSSTEKEKAIADYLAKENGIAFNLEKAPLVRVSLLKSGEQEYVFFMTMHHIIGDGWSSELLVKEMVTIYNSLIQLKEINLPELRIQYKDYAGWLNQESQQEHYKASETYWLNQFSGSLPVIELPESRKRPLVKTYNGDFVNYQFSNAFLEKVTAFSQKHDVTLFITLMAGINTLLSRYTGQQDIIIGSPIAGREHPDLENQIGVYLNTLALRTQVDKDFNFMDLLRHEKEVILGAYEHQSYPFDELVDKLKLKRDNSRSTLFDVMVVLQSQSKLNNFKSVKLEGLEFKEYQLNDKTSKFDFIFSFTETDTLSMEINYNTDIYDLSFVDKIAIHFEQLLSRMIDQPETKIQHIDYLDTEEKQHLLVDFNNTMIAYPRDKTIVSLFEEQAEKTPDHIAVVFEGKEMTYKQLNEEANELGYYLRDNYQIQPDDFVGIKLGRSEKLIISILGILKSGGAYVPIDANYPQERIKYIEEDTHCKIIIDESEWNIFKSSKVENKKGNLPLVNSPKDLAYVIYTSGTTGNPKGVMVEHRSVVRLVKPGSYFPLDENKVLLSTGAVSFDATIIEFFGTLLNGAKLIIAKQESLLETSTLKNIIKSNKVNCLWMTASWFSQVADSDINVFDTIDHLIAGGDVVSPVHTKKLFDAFKSIKMTNGYGPTENTTFSLTHEIKKSDTTSIPIGKPIENSTAYILDEQLQPVPVGVSGTLYVAGDGLSRGYLNKPELTAEKFIVNPFVQGTKMYNTGDLAKWLPDGDVIYLGRNDDQVKIRGHRIELGEIERNIADIEEISQSVVVINEKDGDKIIVAYYVSDKKTDKKEIQECLSKKLPDYMLPGYYIQIDSIPLTSNGKADKNALPAVTYTDLIQTEYVEPETEIEIKLATIWMEVLTIEKVGVTDNFFEIGGHSIKAMKLISKIKEEFEVNFKISEIFINPTLLSQAQLIASLEIDLSNTIPVFPEEPSYPVSFAQRRLLPLSQIEESSVAYNIPTTLVLKGDYDPDFFIQALHAVVERHEILRTVFKEDLDGNFSQCVKSPEELGIKVSSYDFTQSEKPYNEVFDYVYKDSVKPFDIKNGPLVRFALLKVDENTFVFYSNLHHIIFDGWSYKVLKSDVMAFYNAFRNSEKPMLSDLRIQYKDFAIWQLNTVKGDDYANQKTFWKNQFEGEIPQLNLSFANNRPNLKTYNGSLLTYIIDGNAFENFIKLTKTTGTTPFLNLLGIAAMVLYRNSLQKEIIIGSPVSGRIHPDLDNQVGFYVNTLPLKIFLDEEKPYQNFVETIKENVLACFDNQSYPFDVLLEDLDQGRDLSRSPLFDVMLTLNEYEEINENLIRSGQCIEEEATSKYDLLFEFDLFENNLQCRFTYNTDLFEKDTIEKLISDFKKLLENVSDDQSLTLNDCLNLIISEKELLEQEDFLNAIISEISEEF